MKDHFTAYRKDAFRKNIAIVASAFVLAISVNAVLFGTETGARLQTSAVEFAGTSGGSAASADISAISAGTGTDLLKLRLASEAKGVKEFRLTLLSDPTTVKIRDVFSTDKDAEIVKISNDPGVLLLNVRYTKAKDIPAGTEFAMVAYSKTGSGKTVLNFIETSFVSDGATYELSNAPLEF